MYDDISFVIIGTFLGILLAILFILIVEPIPSGVVDLGQSICEEEHKMDFKSYSNGVLECKPTPTEKKYDGIKVRIVGGD